MRELRIMNKPGVAAAWSLTISPSEPLVTARLLKERPFLGAAPLALPGSASPPLMTFGHATHYARIDADAQVGLAAGGCSIALLRAHPEDFDRLTTAKAACDRADKVDLVAELSLGWATGKLASVGRFAITAVTPTVEGVAYAVTLQGREWIAHRLAQRRVTDGSGSFRTPEEAVVGVLKQCGFTPGEYRIPPEPTLPPQPKMPALRLSVGAEALGEVQRLGQLIEGIHRREGRGPLLVRGGRLHIGVGRAVPFSDTGIKGKPIGVSADNGLIAQAETRAERRDPRFEFGPGNATTEPEMRRSFRLTLVGAPEIRPGDVVAFPLAASPLAASPEGLPIAPDWKQAMELYVATVNHRIERDSGFITILTGVEVETTGGRPTSIWDVPSSGPGTPARTAPRPHDDGTPEGALSTSVQGTVERTLQYRMPAQVGEVVAAMAGSGAGPDHLPLSTEVIVNPADPDGTPRLSALGEIFRSNPSTTADIAYASPFAWGPFGLVVPRYPGTRVMLVHPRGDREDPVDVGALWHGKPGDDAARPVQALAEDWWLSLPAGVEPADKSEAMAGPVLPPSDALATNDLIDSEGNRIIEVGRLLIRVGDKALGRAGDRPATNGAPDRAIVIEQMDGEASITMEQDGTVTIRAKHVAVEVSGTMDVKQA